MTDDEIRAEVFAALTTAADENDFWVGGSDPACLWSNKEIETDLLAYNDGLQGCEAGDLIPHIQAWRVQKLRQALAGAATEQPMREFRDTCHGKTEEHP